VSLCSSAMSNWFAAHRRHRGCTIYFSSQPCSTGRCGSYYVQSDRLTGVAVFRRLTSTAQRSPVRQCSGHTDYGDVIGPQSARLRQQRPLRTSGCEYSSLAVSAKCRRSARVQSAAVRPRDRCAHLSSLAACHGADTFQDGGAGISFIAWVSAVVPGELLCGFKHSGSACTAFCRHDAPRRSLYPMFNHRRALISGWGCCCLEQSPFGCYFCPFTSCFPP